METGSVVSWAKNEGDEVSEGDLLAEIETDKATMSFDASDAGYLAKILAPAGTRDIPVGTPLCIIVEDSSSVAAFKDYVPAETAPTAKPQPSPPPAAPPAAQPSAAAPSPAPVSPVATTPTVARSTSAGQRVFASPLARRLAAEQGIDLATLAATKCGTGMDGMIRSADLAGVQPGTTASATFSSIGAFGDLPISADRAAFAQRAIESQRTVPHYYLTTTVEVDDLIKMRDQINARVSKRATSTEDAESMQVTLNDIIIKAAAVTCLKVPECNSAWQGDFIRQFNTVDVNVSISTPEGLINPVVHSVETKGLIQLTREIRALTTKARENKLEEHEKQIGTFTVSNLGMFGISSFEAIINPPQACFLAIGGIQAQLVPDSNEPNGFRKAHLMSITLSCDHRVVDGAVGAAWLAEFKASLETPGMMLA